MLEKKRKKRNFICLSYGLESDDSDNDDADEDDSISSLSEDESDEVTEDDYLSDHDEDEDEEDGDDESLCSRVIFLLQESKMETVKHSIKNNLLASIVLIFLSSFDKVTRHGRLLGERTIAGRVVNESYGVAKQQHTFTIEILWSKGINRLPTLFPLLVKGRNLYKLKTFRQLWNNEEERERVLAEKHKRGAVARFVRATRKTKKPWTTNTCARRQKHSHQTRLSQMSKTTKPAKSRYFDGPRKAMPLQHAKFRNYFKDAPPRNPKFKKNLRSGGSQLSQRRWNFHRRNYCEDPTLRSFTPSQGSHMSQIAAFQFCGHDKGYTSTRTRVPHFKPFSHMSLMTSRNQGYNNTNNTHHSFLNPSHNFEPGDLNCFPALRTVNMHSHQNPSRTEACGQRKNGFQSVLR